MADRARPAGPLVPLLVLYGSNTGSCEAFAQRFAEDAAGNGFAATVAPLDDIAGRLPKDGAVVIITASYEGQPPDNARQFVAYADALAPGDLEGVRFGVFGCGNRQWARTYQAIPKRIDAALAQAGAARIVARGEADSGGDFFGAFDEWYAALWPALARTFGIEIAEAAEPEPLELEVLRGTRERALRLGDHELGTVVVNRELVDMTQTGARSKRHLEIALPAGMTYRTGDYLAVLARNGDAIVDRAIRRFGLTRDTELVLRKGGTGGSALPLDRPIAAWELLASYVELNQPATRAQVATLAAAAGCPPERSALEMLAGERYEQVVLDQRASLLDLVEDHGSVDIGLAQFLGMLPPMRARQYSIASSPLWRADHVALTIAVVDAPALSGDRRYRGVASTYLADAGAGDHVSVSVRPSNARFSPPADPRVPMVMICAGSGVAPFRGFIEERAAQKRAGQLVGPSLLFFGIDAPDVDYLYRDAFYEWEQLGIVQVLLASSEAPEDGIRFVQDRVWAERARIADFFRQDAIFYLCGDGRRMAPAVRDALIRIYKEATGADDVGARAWADEMEHDRGRFVSDVFA